MPFKISTTICNVVVAAFLITLFFGATLASAQTAESPPVDPNIVGGQNANLGGTLAGTTPAPGYIDRTGQTQIKCDEISRCLVIVIYTIGPLLASKVAYVGAYFFSIMIQLSLNSTAYALDFLATGWETVRDLANMAFIFILIYISMTIMLQSETTGTVKMLAIVIVIALLVNFSFFFTRVVIDTGNILAVQFYNVIPQAPGAEGVIQGTGIKDLSTSIMGAIKPQTLLSSQSFDKAKTAAGESEWGALGIFAVIYLSMATMMWILFFAFLQVGIKFLLRIVGLWFILISSPLAFVARTMKGTKHYFDQWLKMLVQFSLYPAIFMFMFLLLTKFAEAVLTVNTSGGGDFLGSIVNSLPTSNTSAAAASISISAAIASVAIRLGFIIALLYVSLRVSDWVVQQGSGLASAISGQMTGLPARGLAAGGGFFGRNTLGWAGTKVARSTSVRALAGGSSNLAFVGKGLRAAGKYTGSASFDVRGAGGVKAVLDKVGVAAGKGQKGGYIERSNASADVKEKAAKDLEPTAGEKEKAKEEAGHIAASKEKEQAKTVLDNGAARIKSLESAGKKGTPEFENAQRAQKVNQEAYSAADIKLKAVEARAKELSGEGLSKKFAQGTLLSRWAPTAGNPGWVTRSSREAATKLLKSKGAGEKEEHGDDHKPDGDGSGGGKGGGGAKGGSGGSSNSASGTSHAPTGGAGAHSSLSSLEQAMEKNTEVLKGIAKSVRQQANNSTYSFSASAPEINTAELGKVIGKTVVKGLENSDILRAPLPNIGPANENSSAPKAANDNNPVPRPPIQAANDNKPDASDSKAA